MRPLPATIVPALAAGLAIERRFQLPGPASPGLFQRTEGAQRDPTAPVAAGFQKIEAPLMALPMVGSACGLLGDGIAGPPAHMIAFQASHSSRSASRILTAAAERISTDS